MNGLAHSPRNANTSQSLVKQTVESPAAIFPIGTRVTVITFDEENNGLSVYFTEEIATIFGTLGTPDRRLFHNSLQCQTLGILR